MNNKEGWKKLPDGISDFEVMRTQGYKYVDKTKFIEVMEKENNPYHFFIRPRKFGKSLLFSTLYNYYCLNRADKFQQLFGDLYIGQNPTPNKNSLAVLMFNFSGLDTASEDGFKQSFDEKVRDHVCEFLDKYRNVFNNADQLIEQAQGRGVGALNIAYGAAQKANVKMFIIIDEYDHFANNLIAMGEDDGHQFYKNMVRANGLVRAFYETVKIGTSAVVGRIFITGISPVMLDDLTSGFNIAKNLTLDPRYNEMMGFTQQEVTQLMQETGVDPKLITVDMEHYYNGYLFNEEGRNRVYNPAMTLFFFDKILTEKRTPKQLIADNLMVDYGKIERLIENEDNENVLINIVKDKGISAEIISMFSIDRMYSNEYFVSLLFYMGLLTIDGCYDGDTRLKIPNYSIQTLYWDFLVKLIAHTNKDVKIDNAKQKNAIKELAFNANPIPFFEYVSNNIFSKFSNRDLIHYDEKYIKTIILCCSLQNNAYVPLSEVEVNTGYIDVFLHRGPQSHAKYEWVWEIKYVKDKDANTIPDKKQEAVKQLLKYKQTDLFKNKNDVKYAAVVFVGKDKYEIQEVE